MSEKKLLFSKESSGLVETLCYLMGKSDIAKIVANVKKGSDCATVIPAIHCLVFTEKAERSEVICTMTV